MKGGQKRGDWAGGGSGFSASLWKFQPGPGALQPTLPMGGTPPPTASTGVLVGCEQPWEARPQHKRGDGPGGAPAGVVTQRFSPSTGPERHISVGASSVPWVGHSLFHTPLAPKMWWEDHVSRTAQGASEGDQELSCPCPCSVELWSYRCTSRRLGSCALQGAPAPSGLTLHRAIM